MLSVSERERRVRTTPRQTLREPAFASLDDPAAQRGEIRRRGARFAPRRRRERRRRIRFSQSRPRRGRRLAERDANRVRRDVVRQRAHGGVDGRVQTKAQYVHVVGQTRGTLFFFVFFVFFFFFFFADATRRDLQRKRFGVARREPRRGVARPRGAAEVARAHGEHDSVRLVTPDVPLDRDLSHCRHVDARVVVVARRGR
jgi:hypothetical protein